MNKHPSYKPQRRKFVPRGAGQPAELVSKHRELTTEETLAKLSDMFQTQVVGDGGSPDTVLGSFINTAIAGSSVLLDGERLTKEDLDVMLPEIVLEVRSAILRLQGAGFDIANSSEVVSRPRGLDFLTITLGRELYNRQNFSLDNLKEELSDKQPEGDSIDRALTARLLRAYMTSRRTAQLALSTNFDDDPLIKYTLEGSVAMQQRLAADPNAVRKETTKHLAFIMSDDVTRMLQAEGLLEAKHNNDIGIDYDLPHQELDFTVLPPGKELRELAQEIVDGASEYERAYVDLERVAVLEKVREIWGKDLSHFAHGKRTGSVVYDEETDMSVDEDYIVLVMSEIDYRGNVLGEHALAISPIACRHAAYLARHDASAGTWRELLPLPKAEAKEYGARALQFTSATGRMKYELMVEKIRALLDCNKDDFHNRLRMLGDGTYRVQTSRDMGSAALKLNNDV